MKHERGQSAAFNNKLSESAGRSRNGFCLNCKSLAPYVVSAAEVREVSCRLPRRIPARPYLQPLQRKIGKGRLCSGKACRHEAHRKRLLK